MKAIVFDRFGEPGEVLAIRDVPIPEPAPGQVRVKMIASPMNPSDLLVVRGRYGALPKLPATPGFEGVGVVDKAGPGLLGRLVVGKRVTVINNVGGNWAEYAVIPARQARPVPSDLPDDQVASFFVNPATVLAMVRHVLRVPKGAWLLQTAANSNLGKMVARLAQHDGIRTINIVRRQESGAELKALGADVVLAAEEGDLEKQIANALGGASVLHAIDPVGGAIGSAALRALGIGGRMLVYGSLSEQPLQVESRELIARQKRVEGFWLGHWMRQQSIPGVLLLFRTIGQLIRTGVLATQTGPRFEIDRITEAVTAAEGPERSGKVLITMK